MSSETVTVIFVIFIGTIMIFFIPLMAVSNNQDEITQVAVQSLVAEFDNNAAIKGKITQNDYETFLTKLHATGNTYDVQIEHKIMTINPNKSEEDILGVNLFYSEFKQTILDKMNNSETGEYLLKKGDYLIVIVKNTNTTLATQIKNLVFSIVGKDTYTIAASASALVVNTGNFSR